MKVLVAYFDVSKAFDSVRNDRLFFQLHNLGIKALLGRLLYKMYNNSSNYVRIGGTDSTWYDTNCGIHQGGFLTLVKHTVFSLCCTIYRVESSPVGHADNLATCTLNKGKIDIVITQCMAIVALGDIFSTQGKVQSWCTGRILRIGRWEVNTESLI